jgi:hypothetical protein
MKGWARLESLPATDSEQTQSPRHLFSVACRRITRPFTLTYAGVSLLASAPDSPVPSSIASMAAAFKLGPVSQTRMRRGGIQVGWNASDSYCLQSA